MSGLLSISTVLPAYNEAENIETTVCECLDFLGTHTADFEVIVINDGSTDGTPGVVERAFADEPRVRLVSHEMNRGYGAALRTGFDSSTMDYIFLMDSDGQFSIAHLTRLLPHASAHDIVIGYREHRADPLIRSINAGLYMMFIRALFGLKVRDVDCAFKLFPRRAYESVRPVKANGALFSAELLIKLVKGGYKLTEVGVGHYPRREGVQSGASLGVIVRMFRELWELRNDL